MCSHHAASRCPQPVVDHSRLQGGPPDLEVPGAAGQPRLTFVHPSWSSLSNTNTTTGEESGTAERIQLYVVAAPLIPSIPARREHRGHRNIARHPWEQDAPCRGRALVPRLQTPPGTDCRSPVHKYVSALLLGGKGTEPAACPASPGHQALRQAPSAAAHPSWGLLAMRF